MLEANNNTELNPEIEVAFPVVEPFVEPSRKKVRLKRSWPVKPNDPKPLFQFPGRFIAFLFQYRSRRLKIGLMVLVLISAIFTSSYTGDFQKVINNHFGGMFYVLFGSLAFSVFFPRLKTYLPVVMATGAACIIKAGALLFGYPFIPRDLVFFCLGSLLAVGVLWLIKEN